MKFATKNTTINMLALLVSSLISFLVRSFFIKYLGEDLLGVNATIAETVNLLSMCELNIQTAIIYKMYKPIIDKDIERQRVLFNLYKKSYRWVCIAILVLGIILLPAIPIIVKTSVDTGIVFAAYIMQVVLVSVSYLVSYYKIILLANQKQYIFGRFALVMSIMFACLQIAIIYFTRSYLLYLAIGYISLIANTIFIIKKTKTEYGEIIIKAKVPKHEIKCMIVDLKEMIAGTISGYVYGSTDNLLISSFFGAVQVGFISNYKMITNVIKSVISSLSSALSPSWGDLLNRIDDQKVILRNYRLYIFIQYIIGMVLLLPTWLLLDDFIIIWIGKKFLIKKIIITLIILDIFMTGLNEPTCVIIRNLGMFKEEKRASIIAAISNILFSIVLAKVIGIEGIFWGTIIAVLEYWVIRSWFVNNRCFGGSKFQYVKFWRDNFLYMISFVGTKILLEFLFDRIGLEINILDFILKGFMIEIFSIGLVLLFWGKSDNFKELCKKFKSLKK